MMKIGIVLPKTPGYSETFFINKIQGLKEGNHKVFLFVTENQKIDFNLTRVVRGPYLSSSSLNKFWVSTFAILKLGLKSPLTAIRFIKLERRDGTSWVATIKRLVINSHILPYKLDWLHFGYAVMGIERELTGKAIGAKVAVSFRGHDLIIYPLKHPGCYKRLWKSIDKVHTISDFLVNEAYNLGLNDKAIVTKITPAINTSLYQCERNAFYSEGKVKIITVARLHWIKGLEQTLEALSIVKEKVSNFEFNIVGDGPEHECLLFTRHQLGLENHVNFFGMVESAKLPDILEAGDLYIQYSAEEGFCNSVLEAQAAGLLCIVSDAEGLKENVIDTRTGWVVPKRRPDMLAQKIIDVIHMPQDELLKISQEAAIRVRNEFNLEKQRKEFIAFYSE